MSRLQPISSVIGYLRPLLAPGETPLVWERARHSYGPERILRPPNSQVPVSGLRQLLRAAVESPNRAAADDQLVVNGSLESLGVRMHEALQQEGVLRHMLVTDRRIAVVAQLLGKDVGTWGDGTPIRCILLAEAHRSQISSAQRLRWSMSENHRLRIRFVDGSAVVITLGGLFPQAIRHVMRALTQGLAS
ncbi:MAG: hypothetical protein LBQ06_04770 [Frankiaceae bacterium]|jgi:hypothetical protein|nr:hypothetical protein [Frankiaceae bacterium]